MSIDRLTLTHRQATLQWFEVVDDGYAYYAGDDPGTSDNRAILTCECNGGNGAVHDPNITCVWHIDLSIAPEDSPAGRAALNLRLITLDQAMQAAEAVSAVLHR